MRRLAENGGLKALRGAGSCRLEVGKELFTREGPALVRRFVAQGHDVFLDLKFHDIRNTLPEPVKRPPHQESGC